MMRRALAFPALGASLAAYMHPALMLALLGALLLGFALGKMGTRRAVRQYAELVAKMARRVDQAQAIVARVNREQGQQDRWEDSETAKAAKNAPEWEQDAEGRWQPV